MKNTRPLNPAPQPIPACNTRRRFLQVVSVSPLAIGCGSPDSVDPQSVGQVSGGLVQNVPVDSLKGIDQLPVCIGRDEAGIYAMTLTCPHAGCDMSRNGWVSWDSVYCSCHGSKFDRYGNVTSGPARSNLQHFDVTLDENGELTVDSDNWVSESTRLVV